MWMVALYHFGPSSWRTTFNKSKKKEEKKIHILLGVTQLSNMSGVGVKNICSALTCSVATID